jgi:Pyruvate/2-oxoacid:ferredoxin oxidoreductase delta subunit
MHNVYERLAVHLSTLGMGLPYKEELLEILVENLTPTEAEVLLTLPTKVAPLQPVAVDEIASNVSLPREKLVEMLESLSERGLLFSGKTREKEKGYALQQVGFGFPQTFFWKGEDTPHARNMANLIAKYFNRRVTTEAYGSSETEGYRYIPVGGTIDHAIQAVFPYHSMESVIQQARVFAVAHCGCRIAMQLRGRGCEHPLEVCLKFDNLAEYLIERGLGREITREEALEVIRESEEAGLVHFVDNTVKDIKHNCNCCGCACWNVGTIKRRKIPRDVLMATYFMRETDVDECASCGNCVEICPVDAVVIEGDSTTVDEDWCIGCGVCETKA